MKAIIKYATKVEHTPRVMQMASLFDLPLEEKLATSIVADLPIEEHPWNVGLIVGPSGSGKSSIARRLWPDNIVTDQTWSADKALIDDFPKDLGIRDVVGLLTSVGLGSPPAWCRPYWTLSNGEAFRATIARALAEATGLTVIDEFSSVVDRQVAQVASHTIQKTVRRRDQQFIAVTCHYDITEWLQPDWTYHVATREFTWGSVQPRPQIEVRLYPVDRAAWPMFAHHHYLSGSIHTAARCFGGWVGDQLIAFAAYRYFPHPKTKNIMMGHRLVVLPDYQGLGIGGRIDDWLGEYLWAKGYRYRNVVAHPAMVRYYTQSPRWQLMQTGARQLVVGPRAHKGMAKQSLDPRRFALKSFEYRPPKKEGSS